MTLVQKKKCFWDFLPQWQNNLQMMSYDIEEKGFAVTSARLNSRFKRFFLLLAAFGAISWPDF